MKNLHQQIITRQINNHIFEIFIQPNNFLAGEIDLLTRTFYSIPRSHKNLFFLFHNSEGGLGLNEEILFRSDYDIIKIKFCDAILVTSRLKWLEEGIVSPYCDQRVDKQIILQLSKINLDKSGIVNINDQEPDLFENILCEGA